MKVINPNSKISNDEALGIQNILKESLFEYHANENIMSTIYKAT